MRSLRVVIIPEGGEPARSAGSSPHPRLVKSSNPHRKRLEPLFDLSYFEYLNPASDRHIQADDGNDTFSDTAFVESGSQ